VPVTEEVVWRGIATGALLVLGVSFPAAVALSIPLGVAAHRQAFNLRGLLTGVAPSSVGIAVAYLFSANLSTAVLVHVAADLEILFPLPAVKDR
jgi:membrane protease YdiL (CAAX protease family)